MLILCGLPCCGKTTWGKKLADQHALPFFDTDHMIETLYGRNRSVPEICREEGEAFFRSLETEVILSLKSTPSIIALGGGSLVKEENRAFLNNLGTKIYLQAPLPLLFKRLLKRGLPSFLDPHRSWEHFQQIATERIPIFESFATHIVDIGYDAAMSPYSRFSSKFHILT